MKKITMSLLSLIALSTLASASNYNEYLNYDTQKENAKPLNYSQLDRTNIYDVSTSKSALYKLETVAQKSTTYATENTVYYQR